MSRPLRIYNTSDLAEMSDAEIKGRIVPLILDKFASDSSYDLKGSVQSHSSHTPSTSTNIGNFHNRVRDNDVGYHHGTPGNVSATTTTNYCLSQEVSDEASSPTWPVQWEGSGVIHEMNSTKLKTDILRCCAEEWRKTGTDTGVGSYAIATSGGAIEPGLGGTWTRADSLTNFGGGTGNIVNSWVDTYRVDGTDSSTTWYLWRKTAGPSKSSGDQYVPCKTSTESSVAGNIRQMTDADVEGLVNEWRNFLLTDQGTIGSTAVGTIGSYQLTTSSSAPSGGTWTQMGSTFQDKLTDVASQQYSNQFTGYSNNTMYTQQYDRNYTRNFSANFTGYAHHTMYTNNMYTQSYRTHYGNFGGARYSPYYSSNFNRNFTRHFSANFTGYAHHTMYTNQYNRNFTRHFNAQYTGYFAGDTIQSSLSSTDYYLWRRIG